MSTDQLQSILDNIKAQHKNYGLNNYITGIIHSYMVEIIINMTNEIWDNVQLVVVTSQEKHHRITFCWQ